MFIDPSGHIIQLSSDATKKEKQAYERAIAYLETSSIAADLISRLIDHPEVFTVAFFYNEKTAYDYKTKTFQWDPTSGGVLADGKSVFSAALRLVHEMGHASQHLDGYLDAFILSPTNKLRDEIEADNLKRHENPIAKDLGEFVRTNYLDGNNTYRVNTSTDWGVIHTSKWWHFWRWGKPRETLKNKNPWQP